MTSPLEESSTCVPLSLKGEGDSFKEEGLTLLLNTLILDGVNIIRRVHVRLRVSLYIIPPPLVRKGDKGGGLLNNLLYI